MRFSTAALAAVVVSVTPVVLAWEDTCSPFEEIYANGTELCEAMWNGAFKVVPDEENGYTMWFFDTNNNPNDQVTAALNMSKPDVCGLDFFHKDAPSAESDDMRECHPWKNHACCHADTVSSVDKIRESYGAGYEYDRCGPMSQACERFFIQEACFYECEPNAGLFRKYSADQEGVHPDFNAWQMHQMPIKQSYCDAWFDACRNDYFCGKGEFFECDAHYWSKLEAQQESSSSSQDNGKDALTISLAVIGAIAAIALASIGYLIYKEKKGKPVFLAESEHTVS
jgi:folate receptor